MGRQAPARLENDARASGSSPSAGSASAMLPTHELVAQEGDVVYLAVDRRTPLDRLDELFAATAHTGSH